MRIGVFTYDFGHKKSRDGLFNLFLSGYKPVVALAAPWKKLDVKHSKLRTVTKGIEYAHPKQICKKLEVDYHVVDHNSDGARAIIKDYNLDLGIILGARILSKDIIDSFNIGVLNLHPGLLPENRGLDNIKWAIVDDISQGVTAHLIDDKIDRGMCIARAKVITYKDDSLVDITARVQAKEQDILIWALELLESGSRGVPLEVGKYNKAMPWEIEQKLI